MPHQCTKCGKIYSDASEEILKGCSCGSRFFYYIKQEKLEELKKEVQETISELDKADKDQIEKDIRELTGLDEKPDQPVILNLESVRVIKPGKFEIDIVNLFSKKRPLIYKLEEGKYIIDLAASLKTNKEEVNRKIRDPGNISDEEDSDEEEEKEDKESRKEDEVEEEANTINPTQDSSDQTSEKSSEEVNNKEKEYNKETEEEIESDDSEVSDDEEKEESEEKRKKQDDVLE